MPLRVFVGEYVEFFGFPAVKWLMKINVLGPLMGLLKSL